MDTHTLHVQAGEEITPAWKRLEAWVRSTRVISSPGLRVHRTTQGTHVYADTEGTSWAHPFRVSIGGLSATVDMGTINNRVPIIEGEPLDGKGANNKAVTVPPLKLTGKADGKSWIAVRVPVDDDGKEIEDEPPIIEQVETLEGAHPLAVLYWDAGQVSKSHQITHFNLQHQFLKATATNPARHLFWV